MIVSTNFTSEENPPERLGSWARTKKAQILQWSSNGRTLGSYPGDNVRIVRLHPNAAVVE